MNSLNLSAGWQCRALAPNQITPAAFGDDSDWIEASVPGSIHQDLIRAGKIPDPFFGTNENDVQWIGETDWLYHCTFDVSPEILSEREIDLCFDGLDTYATVWLNDELILRSENMFVPARLPIKRLLGASGNRLYILFESALRHGKELEAKYGKLAAWNGDVSRLYVRKAQYHYGWDWGPTFLTAGLWREARIEAYAARIADVYVPATVSDDLQMATIPVQIELSGALPDAAVTLKLHDPSGNTVAETTLPAGTLLEHTFVVANPVLWYPNGSGAQARYTLDVTLAQGDVVRDSRQIRIGLRRLHLMQEPLTNEPGTSFYFEINNQPLFSGGANWIPADSFTPSVTPERYQDWLQLAADGNMNMLRVWGGGIYEEDVFYDLCDELGLLVWQDFMFACGMYPAHPEFLASVRAEAEANIRRLRNHPSIVLWAGNNEDYQIAESQQAYDPNFQGDFTQTKFPAREIYERLLPEVCAKLDPSRPYWRGSPYGGKSSADPTIGDRHTWEIWHGNMADYQRYTDYAGRFVSEFGMEAAPHRAMIDAFTNAEDRVIGSAVLNHHNKAGGGVERLNHYLQANIANQPKTLDDYIYATQFIQSEAMAAAVDGFRRRWAGKGHYATSGALIWQLNDCWPVTSWALVDYELRPKAAYYRVKRSFAPIALGMVGAQVWAVNGTAKPVEAELELTAFTFDGEELAQKKRNIRLAPFQSTEAGSLVDFYLPNTDMVIGARLIQNGEVIARAALWPEPPRSAIYIDPGLKIQKKGDTVTIYAERPARAVLLIDGESEAWSDNMLDVLPNDPRTVRHFGKGDSITVRSYNTLT